MSIGPSTKTFADLKREVQRAFGDESGVQLETQDIVDFANNGLNAINDENGILKSRSTTSAIDGQREYTFPSLSIARVDSIQYSGRYLPNLAFQEAQDRITEADPTGQQTGTPLYWFSYGETFWLWPTPNDGGTIELFYVRTPEALNGALDQLLGIPDKWFNALRDYVLQRAYEMDQDWQAAQAKGEQFQAALSSFSQEENQAQWSTFPVVREVI